MTTRVSFFNLSTSLIFTADPPFQKRQTRRRIITQTTVEKFISRFSSDNITMGNNDVELLTQSFNNLCSSVLDEVAPLKSKSKPICNPSPWVTDDVRCLRRSCRSTERLWKSTGLEVHRLYLKDLMQDLNNLITKSRSAYFSNLITSSKRNPKVLFDTINNIVSPPATVSTLSSQDDCNRLL